MVSSKLKAINPFKRDFNKDILKKSTRLLNRYSVSVSLLQFFSIVFTHLANHGSTSSNAHIYSAQQESSLANGLTISHCFHTNFFEF